MAEIRINLYEGLFLLHPNAAAEFQACLDHIKDVLTRAEAEILVLRKWDERKLAYAIHGQKRGIYILAVFKARASQIANIDRDCNLSEKIVRALITKGDHVGEIELQLLAKENEVAATEVKLREGAADQSEGEAQVDAAAQPDQVAVDEIDDVDTDDSAVDSMQKTDE